MAIVQFALCIAVAVWSLCCGGVPAFTTTQVSSWYCSDSELRVLLAGVCSDNFLGTKGVMQTLAPSLATLTQLQSLNLESECMLQHGGAGQ